jgi:integrase
MATIVKRGKSHVVVYRGPDRKQRWEGFKRKKDAERRKSEVEHQLHGGRFVDPRDLQRTVGEAWDSFKKTRWGSIRKGTQAFYEGRWRVHVGKRWKHDTMRSIGTEAIEAWQAEMITAGTGERTASAAVAMLGRLFRHALRYRWVEHNPAGLVHKARSTSRVRAWTPDQVATLIAAADQDTAVLIRFAASTGLRFGELAGLKWPDIDLDAGRVRVERQWGLGVFSELKTENARRVVPLATDMVKELRLWKLRSPPNDDALVFPSPEGGPLDASNFHTRVWRPLLKEAEVPHGRFHSLRHSFASALINANMSAKLVQTLLGHHSAAFTMDVYADLWPQALEGVGDSVAGKLFSGVEAAREARVSNLLAKEAEIRLRDEQTIGQVIEINGGPCRDRTYDQEIKSLLLYQLS